MDTNLYMNDAEYIQVLKNLRAYILSGAKLTYFDDTSPGNKSTECSWGLCGNNPKVYSEPHLHLWPEDFISRGQVAPKYFLNHHMCPFERQRNPDDHNGCFYRCWVFGNRKKHKTFTREEVIARIDQLIAKQEHNQDLMS